MTPIGDTSATPTRQRFAPVDGPPVLPPGWSLEDLTELARAVHEGDWVTRIEWRWDRARPEEQALAGQAALGLARAWEAGDRDQETLRSIIEQTYPTRGRERVRATQLDKKTERARRVLSAHVPDAFDPQGP